MKYGIQHIIFIFFLFYIFEGVQAQTKSLDSLQKRLPLTTSDTAKVNLMNKINFLLNRQNSRLALQKTKETILLAQKNKYILGELVALRAMAIAYSELGKPDSAHICLDKSFKMHPLVKDKYQDAAYYSALGNLYLDEGLQKEALKVFQKCLTSLEELKDSSRIPGMLNNIGIIHKTNGNIAKSREYLLRTLEMTTHVKNHRLIVSANTNLGISYLDSKEYTTALTYLERAHKLSLEFEGQPSKFALYNLGRANLYLKNYTEANRCLNECLSLAKGEKDITRQILAKKGLAEVANAQKKWDLAIQYGDEALEMTKETKDMENYRKVYEVLFDAYKGARKFEKAIEYQTLMMQAKDSIFNIAKTKQINELETQYEVEKKDTENHLLKKEKDLQDARIKTQMWIIFSILIIIGLVVMLSVILYKGRQKEKGINLILESQKLELESKNGLLEGLNEIKDRLFSIISHDLRVPLNSLKGLLTLLNDNTLSETQVKNLFPKLIQEVNYTSNLLDSLLSWAKSQLNGIHANPQTIMISQIATDNIALLGNIAEQKHIQLINEIAPNIFVRVDEDMLQTILRNLISNALKFTNANGFIRISAQTFSKEVEICVEDTGVGIPKDILSQLFRGNFTTRGTKNEKGTGLGLMLVKDFVEKNNGRIWVESEEGKGSKFIFTLPLAEVPVKVLD